MPNVLLARVIETRLMIVSFRLIQSEGKNELVRMCGAGLRDCQLEHDGVLVIPESPPLMSTAFAG
jgi:hypothetical protein